MNYMEEAIKEADIAYLNNEVPIGAVIVMNNQIIARAHNERIASNDVTDHAEVRAIRTASNVIGDWRLNGCDLYVTVEPCTMCKEIIKASRIDNVYYLLEKSPLKKEYNKTNICSYSDRALENKYKEKLNNFFNTNCNR